jgi:hypothetical protein
MAYDPFIVGMVFGGKIVQSALCPKLRHKTPFP